MTHYLPQFSPMLLQRRRDPFDDPKWIFELKYDGFRALAYVERGQARLVSRKGNVFGSFEGLAGALHQTQIARSCVLDGEIVCLDHTGHPDFKALFYRRSEPIFVAFDLLWLNGRDLRGQPLIDRKELLRGLVPRHSDRLLYADHVEAHGSALFERACALDLEGIVAKHRHGLYVSERERSTWIKIKNAAYTQAIGREEMFEGG